MVKNMRYIKLFMVISFLAYNSIAFGNPSNSISVPNQAVANSVISSSDYNANNNSIQTTYNTHTHTDINQLATVITGVWAASPIAYNFLTLTSSVQPTDISSGYGLVPSGVIVMWKGSVATIPSGWHLCDGTTGTPDLRNMFIVGAGQDGGTHTPGNGTSGTGYYAPAATGGEDKHQLSVAEIPSHTHGMTTTLAAGSNLPLAYQAGNPGSALQTGSTGGDGYHENRPPFYSLAYIMKI